MLMEGARQFLQFQENVAQMPEPSCDGFMAIMPTPRPEVASVPRSCDTPAATGFVPIGGYINEVA